MKNITAKLIICATCILISLHSVSEAQVRDQFPKKEKRGSIFDMKTNLGHIYHNIPKAKTAADMGITRVLGQLNSDEGWLDFLRSDYSYSEDRLTISQDYYGNVDDEWVGIGSGVFTFTEDGFPLSAFENYEGESFSIELFYNDNSRLDSVIINEESEDFTYYEKSILNYITSDSIELSSEYIEDGVQGSYDGDYFLNKNGNFIEVYDAGSYIDRYTYYGISFGDFLKNLYQEIVLVEILNDEYYEGEGWIPYSRVTLTESEGKVVRKDEDYYEIETESWYNDYYYEYSYQGDVIVREDMNFYLDEETTINEYRQIYTYNSTVGNENENSLLQSFKLNQNYPNPFNPTTNISFELNQAQRINLKIFNMLGKEVAELLNAPVPTGSHTVTFNAANLPSGLYYYTLSGENFTQTKSMILIK